MPDEGVGGGKIGQRRVPRRQPLQRVGDAREHRSFPRGVAGGSRFGFGFARQLGLRLRHMDVL